MPSWLVSILVNVLLPMAIKLGVPQLVGLLPKLPQSVQDIIKQLADAIEGHSQARSEMVVKAKQDIRDAFDGLKPEIK